MSSTATHIAVRAAALGDDLRTLAPVAQSSGFQGIQLDLRLGNLNLTDLSASGKREVKHILSRSDLELVSLRMQLDVESMTRAAEYDRILWYVKRGVEAAVGLTTRVLCVDLGRLPPAGETKPAKPPVTPTQAGLIIIPGQDLITPQEPISEEPENPALWGAVDTIMHELGILADRTSITLAFSSELSSFASLKRAIEHARCSWFGVDLDTISILRDRWGPEHVISEVGPLIRHVRVRDALKGNAGRTQPTPVGKGSTNWLQLLALLDDGGYAGWFTVDTVDLPNRITEAQRARAFLA